jgi:hypothetical protein
MMNKVLVVCCLFLLALSDCKKYPDGPRVSLMPRRERIEGKWIAEKVIKDQADVTTNYKNYIWEFTRQYSVITQVDTVKHNGIWSTTTMSKDFVIDYDDGRREIYEIRRMVSKAFWIRNRQTQIEFHLKPY